MAPVHSRQCPPPRPLPRRAPGQPLLECSSVTNTVAYTQTSSHSITNTTKPQRPARTSSKSKSCMLSVVAAHQHYPARRRCITRPSRLAWPRTSFTNHNRKKLPPQRTLHLSPALRRYGGLPDVYTIIIMARKQAAGRLTATGKRSRRGRPKALARDQVPVDSYEALLAAATQASNPVTDAQAAPEAPATQEVASIIPSIEGGVEPDSNILNTAVDQAPARVEATISSTESTPIIHTRARRVKKTSPVQDTHQPTSDMATEEPDESSSELSSVPSSIGSTPEGLTSPAPRHFSQPQNRGSPPRRSQRLRKRSLRTPGSEETEPQPKKRRTTAPTSDDEGYESEKLLPQTRQTRAQIARETKFYNELEKHLVGYDEVEKSAPKEEVWTNFNPKRVIMYGSDATTQYTPAYAPEHPRRGGRTNGRGASRGGRGAGNGRGRGGKNRGRGREEDTPEPPHKRSQEELLHIKHCKARQAELRKAFAVIAPQQAELLDALASKDLARLVKKAKAHKQVPEYEEVVAQLNDEMSEVQDIARARYSIEMEAAQNLFEQEKAVIEARLQTKIKDMQEEYTRGAQGDLIIFRRAIAAAHDETRTQDGSEVDYFPQYHELPEANQTIRGYSSTRFTDERPFKHHLLTYDDQARREVIDDDVAPIIEAFARKNAERRAAEELRKTQTMEALSDEAEKQLKEMKGYLIPRPMSQTEDVNSFALSCLADVSEWMARKYPNKQYIYMPLEQGDTLPREILTYAPPPGRGVKVPQPPAQSVQPEPRTPTQGPVASRQPSAAPAQGTRRSLRNLQPNGPVMQVQPQPAVQQPTLPVEPTQASSAPALPASSGPTLAPAPPKLSAAQSVQRQQARPPPIDTRAHVATPPEQSPVQTPQNQTQPSPSHGMQPLRPRHMSQSSLTPQQSPYAYPHQPFSPVPPQQQYGTHHPGPHVSPYSAGPVYPHQRGQRPSPYAQPPQPYSPYAAPPLYPPQQSSVPNTPQQQQNFVFVPPHQGTGPPQTPGDSASQPRARGNYPPQPIAPPHGQQPPPHHDPYYMMNQGPYHNPNRMYGYPYPPPTAPTAQQALPQQPPANVPPHTTSTAKSRARPKAKNPSVTFVNQTLATRKAAAEQLAKEEAAAAAEKKDREREKERARANLAAVGGISTSANNNTGNGNGNGHTNGGTGSNANGRKLAPKN